MRLMRLNKGSMYICVKGVKLLGLMKVGVAKVKEGLGIGV
jgi:hypothetical protein